jgi:cytochrome c-type biogenesis protein CcmH
MMRAIVLAVFTLFLSHTALAAGVGALDDPKLEARAMALQRDLRCVVCQGVSLDESNAPLAADLRALIRARIARGDSDDEVKRYLVSRYGDVILMKPPLEPATYALWFGPLLILILGGMVLGAVVIRARKNARAEEDAT